MNKTLIVFFSKTGNNKFIAEKLSKTIDADIEAIIPKTNSSFLLILSSLFKFSASIKPISQDFTKYDKVVILGPIWMGRLISPIKGFINKYAEKIKQIVFITVCGSGIEDKDGKYGYNGVFTELKSILATKLTACFEISTKLLNTNNNTQSDELLISESVFNDAIKARFDEIVKTLNNY
jgi:flavodoxin